MKFYLKDEVSSTNEADLSDCFWCDVKIIDGDKKELLPENRGYAHEKCAEEWYSVQMAKD